MNVEVKGQYGEGTLDLGRALNNLGRQAILIVTSGRLSRLVNTKGRIRNMIDMQIRSMTPVDLIHSLAPAMHVVPS